MIPNLVRIHVPLQPDICDAIVKRKHYDRKHEILPSVLEAVGETPLIALTRLRTLYKVSEDTEILGKVEFFNAGGSIKDRVARAMIEHKIRHDEYPENGTVIEASSGNTGIGLAIGAAASGRKCLVTMNEAIAYEKEQVLRILGSDVVRTPKAPWYDSRSHIGEACAQAEQFGKEGIFFNQYRHPANPAAHYTETASELISQTQGKIDYCVISLGTCGTAAGLGARFRKELPSCKMVVVEPVGSVIRRLQDPEICEHRSTVEQDKPCPLIDGKDDFVKELSAQARPWKVEGIGKDFLPPLLDPKHVDMWMCVPDGESFKVARDTIKSEGLLIGGSCGTALAAAIELAKGEAKGKRIVVILPDGARNYLTTFLDDGWMFLNKFMKIEELRLKPRDTERDGMRLCELISSIELEPCLDVDPDTSCANILQDPELELKRFLKLMGRDGQICGVISKKDLAKKIMAKPGLMQESISSVVNPLSCVCLQKDANTWLQGLHAIDEVERVWKVQEGCILVDGNVISRKSFVQAAYPVGMRYLY
eukprot:Gregarina_sp_Pseudo_9__5203@NODE_571_length_2560_cov_11_737406_g540_i0_p1_GENE_NODE_571_length_2560_cov_11_737406_g540_i0NODE_571_length_2560_cov_11_737406_g540_i0_p1_ORF_typecomplete_len536_score65_62PALP/PF00291_25/2_1e57_NODE_571_length_2560_cov_11_737406_g540_i0341641